MGSSQISLYKRKIIIPQVIIKEIDPIIFNILDGIKTEKKTGCYIRCRVRGGKGAIIIDINQEIERFNIPLTTNQWNIRDIESKMLSEIEGIFGKGVLNTICRGIDDFIRLKMEIIPGYRLSISTLYSRTETIDLYSGFKDKKRDEYKIHDREDIDRLLDCSMNLVEKCLFKGLQRLKSKQDRECNVGYLPEFFIHRDRLAVTEKYELMDGSLLNSEIKIGGVIPTNHDYVMDLIERFLDKEIHVSKNNQTGADYEVTIDLKSEYFDMRSTYHRIFLHRCNNKKAYN